jgi:hypothetical protein
MLLLALAAERCNVDGQGNAVSWVGTRLEELDAAAGALFPRDAVALEGQWTRSHRRTYQNPQSRPGVGPFVDVVDAAWTGSLSGSTPLAAVIFLSSSSSIHWVKSGPPKSTLSVRLSLASYASFSREHATLGIVVGEATLPAVPVTLKASPDETCAIVPSPITTGSVFVLASTESTSILLLLVPADFVHVGRNRLWHLRERYASGFPSFARELLTHRRTGTLSSPADGFTG